MQEFQKRLINEYKELDDKCQKLEKFTKTNIFDELDEAEQDDMNQQLNYMKQYLRCLKSRCNRQNLDLN